MKLYFSKTSKMPCKSWSIPAQNCKTGSKLARIENSVCASCYALKGFYVMPSVMSPRQENYENLLLALGDATYRAFFIEQFKSELKRAKFFRWFDSGDLQSVEHLQLICDICKALPECKFWLPTKERSIIVQFQKRFGQFPKNLCVRISSYMIGSKDKAIKGATLSTVGCKTGHKCPATYKEEHQGKCLDCRACWSSRVKNVDYKLH